VSEGRVYIEGELYLTVETVAELYQVRTVWLREVCEIGLLGGVVTETRLCIAAVELDRVAAIVRLGQNWGLDLETIALVLDEE